MKPTVMKALEEWKEASDHLQDRAVNALRLALPGLDYSKTPPYCCPATLDIAQADGLGDGRICIDDDRRATIELDHVPNAVIAEAVDEVFGIGWFDNADEALEDCGPGSYFYDDETSGSEYEVRLSENPDDGHVAVSYVPIPYAVELLDALTAAYDRQRQEATDGARDGSAA
ncbi:hypothetical protein [Streptomyces rimosus]|uniref:hypothetical protein n=1 Tax=Streptomyces rimosus TaxID=1927 RepID=UPI0004BEC833|nr:hypothetical protein [Streptomyces rimosus]